MRRDPEDPFDDIFREIERMMENMMGGGEHSSVVDFQDGSDLDTHVNVHEYDDRITVIADLPGVEKSDIELQCDGRTLWIRATSGDRHYDDRVRLPGGVDEQSAEATYNNGVLEVTLDREADTANIDVE